MTLFFFKIILILFIAIVLIVAWGHELISKIKKP